MDSDCLIKLARASLKEVVCRSFSVEIPQLVKKEVIDDASGQPDAARIRENVESHLLSINEQKPGGSKEEEAVFSVFQSGHYDAICSDDKRFIRRLRMFSVPYVTPAVLITLLLREGRVELAEAYEKLKALAPMISEEEHTVVKLALDNWRKK